MKNILWKRLFIALAVSVSIIVIASLLTGCYTADERCGIATAKVDLYERWAADPAVTLDADDRRHWVTAATEERLWCEHPLSREN